MDLEFCTLDGGLVSKNQPAKKKKSCQSSLWLDLTSKRDYKSGMDGIHHTRISNLKMFSCCQAMILYGSLAVLHAESIASRLDSLQYSHRKAVFFFAALREKTVFGIQSKLSDD